MKMVLIGNYPPDKQVSMDRFATMLKEGFEQMGVATELWRPIVFFGKFSKSTTSAGKWLGYIDKLLLFSIIIQLKSFKSTIKGSQTYYHICDHSNSIYLNYLPIKDAGITCHDVLAIRGALGYADAYCTASKFGAVLQQWILNSLLKAQKIACVSATTLRQLIELAGEEKKQIQNWVVLYNGFNANFTKVDACKAKETLATAGLPTDTPFILHVGSSLPRKNRKLLIEMLNEIRDKWKGNVVLAGQPLDDELVQFIEQHNLSNRVLSIIKPSHPLLVSLYNVCEAFIFPSYSEGFGWPVIEAQACGAPVIASSIEPMPEVSGGAAIHVNPDDPRGFAHAFLSLQNASFKADLIAKGFENCKRFETRKMILRYLDFLNVKPTI